MANPASVVLTKRLIEAAKPSLKRYEIWDSDVAGFGVRIGLGGSKTFVIRYRAEGEVGTLPADTLPSAGSVH